MLVRINTSRYEQHPRDKIVRIDMIETNAGRYGRNKGRKEGNLAQHTK
jgi:hypothetical protein